MINLFEEFSHDELLLTDVRFLGFEKSEWGFSRGARTERLYTEDGKLQVRDVYSYQYVNGGREVGSYTRQLEWYNLDGEVGLVRVLNSHLSIKALKALNRSIRQGRVDYLEESAENLRLTADSMPQNPTQNIIDAMKAAGSLPAWVVDAATYETFRLGLYQVADSIEVMFSHYNTEIINYISRGTLDFENAIKYETDPNILQILAIVTEPPSTKFPQGITVKQSIMYQLTGEYGS